MENSEAPAPPSYVNNQLFDVASAPPSCVNNQLFDVASVPPSRVNNQSFNVESSPSLTCKYRISIPACSSVTLQSERPPYLMVTAQLKCGDKVVTEDFLVDTGANGIYIHMDLAQCLFGSEFPSPQTETATCVVANAVEEEIFKGHRSSFTVQGRSLSVRPMAMRTLSYRGILGYNVVRALGFLIDPVQHRLLPCADSPTEEFLEDSDVGLSVIETNHLGILSNIKARTIPRRTAVLVTSLLRNCRSNIHEFCLVEHSLEGTMPAGLVVLSGLATMIDSHVPVMLVNTTDADILIPRFTKIASATRVDHRPCFSISSISPSSSHHPLSKRDFLDQFELADELPPKERGQLQALLWKEKEVFSSSDFDIGCFKGVQHTIHTGSERPYKETLRRHSPKTREDLKALVSEMLHHGIIQPSFSPWSSAPVLVQKKSGGKRFAVDYRGLNAKTEKDSYPLPQIADALDCFAGSSFYSTLDLTQGFWQIELDEASRAKTAFTTPQGLYEFRRMPFGLCNAPGTFQRAMACCLEGLNWEIALCFLDDIIVFSSSFEEHLSRLKIIFNRLKEFNLKLKPRKCQFLQTSVSYLGHIVSAEGIAADPKKIYAIQNWQRPQNATQVRSFLGLAQYYRRFVKNFSSLAAPLFECYTPNERKITWGEEQQAAFELIKAKLSEPPIMAHPNFELPFIIDVDASNVGIGCVLSQSIDGKERVISYQSHKFSAAERKWSTTDREFYALVVGCKLFRSYVYGRKFQLRTDHQALLGLTRKAKELTGKLARWWSYLSLYDYSLQYRPGPSHGNADGLSRQPHFEADEDLESLPELNALHCTPDNPVDIVGLQRDDPSTFRIIASLSGQTVTPPADDDNDKYWSHYQRHKRRYSIAHNILLMDKKAVIPRSALPSLLYALHDAPISGHLGKSRTLKHIKARFWWPGLCSDVVMYVKSCIACQERKGNINKIWAPLKPSEPTDHPWERLAMDVLALPPCHGYSAVLVVVDYFSKWVEAFPLRDKSASSVAKILHSQIFMRYGPPIYLHSDRGREFIASSVHELTRLCSIFQTHTPAYAPRADGQVERQIRTLSDMLSKYATEKGQWFPFLDMCLCAIRTSVHETIGFSPFEVLFGRKPRLVSDLNYGLPATPCQKHPSSYKDLQSRLQTVHNDVKKAQIRVAQKMKTYYDSRHKVGTGIFSPGQWVWKMAPSGPRPKLLPKWEGPFLVTEVNDSTVYIKQYGSRYKVSQDRCKLFTERPTHLMSKEYTDSFTRARVDFSQNPAVLRLSSSWPVDRSGGLPVVSFGRESITDDSRLPPPSYIAPPVELQAVEPPESAEAVQPVAEVAPSPPPECDGIPLQLPQTSQPEVEVASAPPPGCDGVPLQLPQSFQPVVLLDRLPPSVVNQYLTNHASSEPTSLQVSDQPPVCRASSRKISPPTKLTYDESFRQVASIGFSSQTFWVTSSRALLDLGLWVVDSDNGVKIIDIDPGSIADVRKLCRRGDFVREVNGVQLRKSMDYIRCMTDPQYTSYRVTTSHE